MARGETCSLRFRAVIGRVFRMSSLTLTLSHWERVGVRERAQYCCGIAVLVAFSYFQVGLMAEEYGFPGLPPATEWRGWAEPESEIQCVWDERAGRTDLGSLKIEVGKNVTKIGWPNWLHTVTGVQPMETWQVTAFVKTDRVRDGHGAYIGLVCPIPGTTGSNESDRLAQADSSPITGTKDWTRIIENIVVPQGATQINLLLLLHGRGTAWFDDVTVKRVSEPPGPVPREITASLKTDEIITRNLWGFGFEDDPFFYNDENRQKGVDEEAIKLHEERIKALRPGWVRSFVWWDVVNPSRDLETVDLSSDNGQSLLRTLKTYQELSVPVVLTGVEWMWQPKEFPFFPSNAVRGARFFAKLVKQLRERHGLTCIKYVMITNEPDLFWEQNVGPLETYVNAHKCLAEALREERLSGDVKIVGADVTLRQEFFDGSVAKTDPYCAAWSRHKYLTERQAISFRDVVRYTVASARDNDRDGHVQPVVFGEFGFHWQGTTDQNHTGVRKYEYGLLTAMACCDMLDGGAAGGSIWCLCRQMYPHFNLMDYGLWGYADEKWNVRPVALAYSLFTRFVRPGDDAVRLVLDPKHVTLRGAAVTRRGTPVALFLVNLSDVPVRAALKGIPAESPWNQFEYRNDAPMKSEDVLLLPSEIVQAPAQLEVPPRSLIALIRADS